MAYRLFLCGDVMTGRGIDQVLPHPCDPALYEDYAEIGNGLCAACRGRKWRDPA